jgi:hypothetical protein
VTDAGIIRLRELKRRTHWERGPQQDPTGKWTDPGDFSRVIWESALDDLRKRKILVVEWDGRENGWAMLPHFLDAFRKDQQPGGVTTRMTG